MGKQTKSRKPDNAIGKGKVTKVQVAFIVDRYLSDNNFVQTRSTFRTEASHLISKSPVNEAPKSLLSLGDMLDEYICLKEQKVMLSQEKSRLDQEKFRVQTLLRGMQDVMNAYSHGGSNAAVLQPSPMVMPLLSAANNTPVMMSTSKPLSEPANFSTPTAIAGTSQPTLKRRHSGKDAAAAPSVSKRTRTQPSVRSTTSVKPPATTSANNVNNNNNNNQEITPVPSNTAPTTLSPAQGSSVAKCLFNAGPQTPSPSPTVSPVGDNQTPPSSNKKTVTPPPFTSTNRTVITSETIHVSPMKQVSYYSIERNQCITSPLKTGSKRFSSVKGRLDFDGSETVAVNSEILTSDENTESPSEGDPFDFDLPNFDCLGPDFNLTALLGDFAFDGEQMGYLGQGDNGSSPESLSPDTTVDDNACDHELVSGVSSTVTEIRSEQDLNMAGAGPNSVTSVKSITKSIKVFSPVKSRNH